MKTQQSKRKRNGKGRFQPSQKKIDQDDKPKEKPKPKPKPKLKREDNGDDVEEIEILRIDNVTTVTARNESGRIVKAFVSDATSYVVGMKREFRIARNGAYYEIDPPPPVKQVISYEDFKMR